LARSELEISQIVWKLGEARVRDVVEALPAERGLNFATVQTYLRRLKAKGYLKTRREGRADVYLPAVSPVRVIRQVVSEFVDRLFEGDAIPLVQHLIGRHKLTLPQIEQLQQELERLKQRRTP